MSNKIVVMYHSIESDQIPAVIGSFPLSMDRFKHQIELLDKGGYKFDFISNLHVESLKDEKIVYITGDDGTVDWTRNVIPWCEENKIPTHTGIITGPFEKNPIYPLTHLIQIVLSTRDIKQLEQLSIRLKKDYLTDDQVKYINKLYFYEDLEYRRIIKGSFNLVLELTESYALIGEYTSKEKELLSNRFESLSYYKQFKYAEVGVHTKSHWALGKNSKYYISSEIESCRKLLIENGLTPTDYFVSPMKPKYGASLEDIVEDMKELGYKAILDSNPGIWDKKSFIIPRIDAKNIENMIIL